MKKFGYLLAMDFDGTCANTFQKSPSGIGVHEAYEFAVKVVFGGKGLDIYKSIGGLQNRAPAELVSALLQKCKELVGPAEECFDTQGKVLNATLMSEGKGAPLEWRRGRPDIIERTISEMLVLAKLSFLMDEVGKSFPDGSVWPSPCMGFLTFMQDLMFLCKNNGLDIDVAIISSGHDLFIQKTFFAWGLDPPRIVITDDDMRGRAYPKEVKKRAKPSSFLFDLVHSEWIGNIGSIKQERFVETVINSRRRMMYFGDDLEKDGGLAINAGVPFGLFCSAECLLRSGMDHNRVIEFGDWRHVADIFQEPKAIECMLQGKPLIRVIN